METIYLRFDANSAHAVINEETPLHWVLAANTNNGGADNCGTVKLVHAGSLIQDRKVIILLPVENLFITTVSIQTKNNKQLEKAVPYALEDDLTEDIENLHFAVGRRADNGETPVMVVARAYLDHVISVLNKINILPDIITADIFGLAYRPNQWTLCMDKKHVLARTGEWSGFGCDSDSFTDFMQAAVQAAEHSPQTLAVYSHPDENLAPCGQFDNVHYEDCWSPTAFIQGFSASNCINVLQGRYAKADKTHKTGRSWKMAAVLAVIWIGVSMAHAGIEYARFKRADQQLTDEIIRVFNNTFPEARNVSIGNVRVRMEQKFKALTRVDQSAGNADFLNFLHQGSDELNKENNSSIIGIQFKNNQLSLEIKTKDIQALEAVKTRLQSKNIRAELQTAKSVDDFIMARIQMSK